ncbi:glycosyltransferase family 4 protein [bacterium]|jgi:glycosyltransferase involved in cell wall biosynthesis|nr:glycosyltransferase family 4 protein [bacterium]
MKIAIDAHCIGKNLAGNNTYTINLVNNLLKLYPRHKWIIYISPAGKTLITNNNSNVKLITLKSKSPLRRYLFEMPKSLRKEKPDVLHIQYHGPFFHNCPTVLTVHDISYEIFPRYFTLPERLRLHFSVPYFIKKANSVITVSEYSRKDMIKKYKIEENKIKTVYNGIDHDFYTEKTSPEDTKLLTEAGIKKPFLLSVGSLQPRKNIEGILLALKKIYKSLPELRWIITGPEGWLSGGIHKTFKENPELHSIINFTGYVRPEMLRALYRNALAMIYAPFYEGFGLPVLEAMACGAPVITSNVTSLPEVAGNAALLVNPNNIGEIAESIKKVWLSEKLRREMSQKGMDRARNFSWQKAAEETFSILESAVKKTQKNKI